MIALDIASRFDETFLSYNELPIRLRVSDDALFINRIIPFHELPTIFRAQI